MRIVLADDHGLVRNGIRYEVQDLDENVEVVEAEGFDELLRLVDELPAPDLALVDLGMPGPEWRSSIKVLKERWAQTPIVVVTASEDAKDFEDALSIGVAGFVPKTSNGKVFLAALRLVLSGGQYIPPEFMMRCSHRKRGQGTKRPIGVLTARQFEILQLLSGGRSNKEIARELNISVATVKVHIAGLLRALDVRNRTEAAAVAKDILSVQ